MRDSSGEEEEEDEEDEDGESEVVSISPTVSLFGRLFSCVLCVSRENEGWNYHF